MPHAEAICRERSGGSGRADVAWAMRAPPATFARGSPSVCPGEVRHRQ